MTSCKKWLSQGCEKSCTLAQIEKCEVVAVYRLCYALNKKNPANKVGK